MGTPRLGNGQQFLISDTIDRFNVSVLGQPNNRLARVSADRCQNWTRSSAIAEGPRDASCQLKSCQLPRNSAETTCTTSPEQIEVMKLEGCDGAMCNKHVHSTITRSSRFHCPIGVINKPTTDELWISPVYRRLAVAKCSKSTM